MRFFLGCLLSALLASCFTLWMVNSARDGSLIAQERRARNDSPVERVRPSISQIYDADGLTPDESIAVSVYEVANRSVVNITAKSRSTRMIRTADLEDSGSGAIIDYEGHILTNYHVVGGAKEIAVTLYNGKTHEATMVGADPLNDLAVIRLEEVEEELFPVVLGDSRSLKVGMRIFALGNPFGLERTLTSGIISSLNRSLQIHGNWKIKSIIQIDAAINPGNSGGPLLDSHGRLIGINTAIATTSNQSSGVGFAIPTSLIARVVPQLLKFGHVIRPESGIDKVYQTDKGLIVAEMRPGGPAEKAGLRGPKITKSRLGPFPRKAEDRSAADLIVAVDDQKIVTPEDFLSYIEGKRPGDEVLITVIRDKRSVQVPLHLTTSETAERSE